MKRTLTLVPWTKIPQETLVEQDGIVMVLHNVTCTTYTVRPATRRERMAWRLRAPLAAVFAWVVLQLVRGPVRDLLVAARKESEHG